MKLNYKQILCLIVFVLSVGVWADDRMQTRTTVKKDLGLTDSPNAALDAELIDGITVEPSFSSTASDNSEPEPEPEQEAKAMDELLPKKSSLFQQDAVDRVQLLNMDCHLRNVDYCFAGVLGTATKALPETDAELETRCDEMKAASTCISLYNRRCSTLKVFSALAPFSSLQQAAPAEVTSIELPAMVDSLAMNRNVSADDDKAIKISMGDLQSICEPDSRRMEANKLLRRRMFQLSKCINQRIPLLRPCFEDLKAAIQVLYEPTRSLPLQPSCCAISRFRHCAMNALDNICGLNSLDQLESALTSGPNSMMRTVERVCRQGYKYDSQYCLEVLPPPGMRVPQRRGRKASKLAKALDLISFAPATQLEM